MSLVWANNVPQQLISTVASTEASWLTFLLETLGSTSHLGWPSAMGSWLVKCTSWSNTKRRGRRRGTTVAVGHWWQGRLMEGVGLMALFFGGFWLADATK